MDRNRELVPDSCSLVRERSLTTGSNGLLKEGYTLVGSASTLIHGKLKQEVSELVVSKEVCHGFLCICRYERKGVVSKEEWSGFICMEIRRKGCALE